MRVTTIRDPKRVEEGGCSSMVGVAEPSMPQTDGGEHGVGRRSGGAVDGVHIARTIKARQLHPGAKILHSQAKRVKFHRNLVINSETAN